MNTGVDLTITDQNASATARNIAGELDKVVKSADNINSAFDPQILEGYTKELGKLTDQFSKLYKLQNEDAPSQGTGITQKTSQFQKLATGAGTALTDASGGNVSGAGIKGLSTLAGLLSGAGGILAGVGITGAIVGNKLADQYEQRATPAGELASLQGLLTSDIKQNEKSLNDAMQQTVDAVSKYGKTYEEGIQARQAYLKSGGQELGESQAGAYSLAYKGENYGELSAFEGLLSRYGQKEGLETTRALQKSEGLGDAQYGEVMSGIRDIFTGYLSKGIIKDVTDIAKSQEFISRAGQTFQGGLGVQKMQTLNQSVASAGNLQSQEDMIWYQAGQKLEGAGGLWNTKRTMEKEGFSPEFFKNLMDQYTKLGYTEEQSKLSFQRKTGLGGADIDALFSLRTEDITKNVLDKYMKAGLPEGTGITPQTGYIKDVENIKQDIISGMGAGAFETRATIVETGADIIKSIDNLATAFSEGKKTREETALNYIENAPQIEAKQTQDIALQERSNDFLVNIKNATALPGVESLQQKVQEAQKAGIAPEDIYSKIGDEYNKFRSRKSEGGIDISDNELSVLSSLLRELITATNGTTEAVKQPINVRGYLE